MYLTCTPASGGRNVTVNIAADASRKNPMVAYSFFEPYKGNGVYYYNVRGIRVYLTSALDSSLIYQVGMMNGLDSLMTMYHFVRVK